MKKTKNKIAEHPGLIHDLPNRLSELEKEIRAYPSRPAAQRILKNVEDPTEAVIGPEKVVQFSIGGKTYAAGHTDITYSGSNHARGVRHIRFYLGEKVVLDIEGDFEDQQFGSNFRFKNIDLYVPSGWEADL